LGKEGFMPGWIAPWLILIGGLVVVLAILVIVVLLAFVSRGNPHASQTRLPPWAGRRGAGDLNSMERCPACGAPVESAGEQCGRCGAPMAQSGGQSHDQAHPPA